MKFTASRMTAAATTIIAAIVCFAFVVVAFLDVGAFVENGRRGVLLFGQNVLPVLFPFFFITSLLVELNIFHHLSRPFAPVMRGLFNTCPAAAPIFLLSLLSGYPVGAKMLAEIYDKGDISREDAIKTATFTSTASPIFVIATLGTCFYGNTKLGIVIFAAMSLGAIANGVLYRNIKVKNFDLPKNQIPIKNRNLSDSISAALYGSIQNILAVGGLIIIFFIASAPFGFIPTALLEMTGGIYRASLMFPNNYFIPCAIVTFGGLCVAMQGFIFLKTFKMPFGFYLLYKLTHTLFALGILFVLGRIFSF